jgi:hypothetical protein
LLLDDDFKRIKTQSAVLRQSAIQSTLSPLGLTAITAVGFIAGRRLLRKRQPTQPAESETTTTTTPKLWWLEILVPVAFTWLREAIITHLQQHNREPPPQ